MKKRIISTGVRLLLVLLFLTAAILTMVSGRQAELEDRRNLQSLVKTLAGAAQSSANALNYINPETGDLQLYVLDPKAKNLGPGLPVEFLSNPVFKTALANGEGISTITIGGTTYVSAIAGLKDGGRLIAAKSADIAGYYFDAANQSRLGFLLILFAGAIFFVFITTRRFMDPLADLTRETAIIAGGDLSARIKTDQQSELAGLAENFNLLADRLETTIIDSLGNQSQLEAILGSMNSGVIAVDKNNKIIIFNPFARKIFDIFTDAIGKDIRDVIKIEDLDKMMQVADQFQELELKRDIVVRFKTTDLLADRSQKGGKVTVIQDVTDLKKLEQMRTQFVANVSHELKTPLTSIKGFTETLREVEDPATKNKFLDIIEAESERLRRLIEDILSLSSIENQERPVTDVIDAAEATKSGMSLLEVQARDKNIDLSLIVKGEPHFIGNADMYRQMIINLVENAIKYTEKNGRVKVRLEEGQDWIILSVQDTGIGIPEDHLPRLFERFYRVDKSRNRAQGGTGLGLAIVKHIVLTFGGTINVESEPGKGTTFTVMLPVYHQKSEQPGTRIQSIKFNE